MTKVSKTKKTNILSIIIGVVFVFAFNTCDDKNDDPIGGTQQTQTPTAADFNISGTGTFTHDGTAKAVTVTAKEGKTSGAVTVKYNGNTTAPSAVGTYTVTFDVAAATDWNAASGLSAGTLIINAGGNVAKIIDAAIETAKAVRYDPMSNPNANNIYTSPNEIYGECGDFALHFVLDWNKNNNESTAYLYINNQGFPCQGLYTPINIQAPKLNRVIRGNTRDYYGFWTYDWQDWVFNSTVAFVDLVKYQDIQTNTHLGVNQTNQPHVWVRIFFNNGEIYDVDPTYLDSGSSTYYVKIQ